MSHDWVSVKTQGNIALVDQSALQWLDSVSTQIQARCNKPLLYCHNCTVFFYHGNYNWICTVWCTYDLSTSAISLSKSKIPAVNSSESYSATLIAMTPNLFWIAMHAVINVHCSSNWRLNASKWQLIHQGEANSAFLLAPFICLLGYKKR